MLSAPKLREKLKSEPGWIVKLALKNNPEGVIQNAQAKGHSWVEREDQVWELLDILAQQGEDQEIMDILSVDFKPENASDEAVEALQDIKNEGAMELPSAAGDDGMRVASLNLEKEDYIRGVVGAIGGLLGGTGGVQQPGTGQQAQPQQPPQKEQGSSIMDYLPWIAAVVVFIILLIVLINQNK
jgi:hypothetical protein